MSTPVARPDACEAETVRHETRIPLPRPFDAAGVLAWMGPRAVAGVEEVTATSFARTMRLPSGPAWAVVTVVEGALLIEAEVADEADGGELERRVRLLFDVATDPVCVDAALSAIPEIAPLVARTPGIRVPGAADPFEMLVRAMVGQQISVAAARTHLTRLAEALGERVRIAGRERTLFPTARALADRGSEVLRGPQSRVRAIVEAARAVADGELVLDAQTPRASLLALRGVGPWTADYLAMRVGRHPDVILTGDLALRAGAAAVGLPSSPAELLAWSAVAAPWRSYLSSHLWRAALPAPKGSS